MVFVGERRRLLRVGPTGNEFEWDSRSRWTDSLLLRACFSGEREFDRTLSVGETGSGLVGDVVEEGVVVVDFFLAKSFSTI